MTLHDFMPTTTLANAWDHLWYRGFKGESNFADGADLVFFFIFWVSVLFFVILMGLMVYFAVKYRRKPGVPIQHSPAHNVWLELSWSVIPSILFAVMFFWGFEEYIKTRVAPIDSEVIQVTAKQWGWDWEYAGPNGPVKSAQTTVLADAEALVFALPAKRPIKFVMSSDDVIHSMYIAAFRIKRDIFPNRYTTLWVEPQNVTHRYEGEGDDQQLIAVNPDAERMYLACTEYCGDQHSQMWAEIIVLSDSDYVTWIEKQGDTSGMSLIEVGELVRVQQGCNACHTVDGSAGTGPSWKGAWGTTRNFTDGGSAEMDINYIRESILVPDAHIVQGYPNQMVSYAGRLTDRELRGVAMYIKSLSDEQADIDAAVEESVRELEESQAVKDAANAAEAGS